MHFLEKPFPLCFSAETLLGRFLDRFAGVLSILWTAGGFGLGQLLERSSFFSRTSTVLFPIVFFGWLGIGFLLVIAGLRRGNVAGRLCAAGSVFVLLHVFGIDAEFENLFRKDEFARPYWGAPECRCRIAGSIHTPREIVEFEETVRKFARQYGIRECRQKRYMSYSGPPRPTYKGEHVAIWSGGTYILLAPYDKSYSVEDFKRLAESLGSSMRAAFPGRVEITRKEAEKPRDGGE